MPLHLGLSCCIDCKVSNQLVDLGQSKPKLPVSGDPDPTDMTPKPMHSWTIGRGAKPMPSPNHTNIPEAPTRRAPSYSQQLARIKTEALSLRDNSGTIRKGPVLDSGANTCVINGRDAKHAKVRYPLNPPLEIKGINGVATATEGCILQIGKLEVQGPIIEGAARSVVNPRSLMHTAWW